MKSTRSDFSDLFTLYLWVGIGVAALIFAAVGFAIFRYRAREGGPGPSRTHEHFGLEIGIAVLIACVVGFLLIHTFSVEADEDDSPPAAVQIHVTAFQWGWRFEYPGHHLTIVGDSNHQPTFAVPGDEPVHFDLTSADVLHAFWIPGERFKRAAIPGKTNEFDLDFEHEGTEEGLCSEFCGLRHSNMRFNVWVLSKASYERWLAAHS